MELSIASLAQAGSFTGRPVKKENRWMQGDKEIVADVYVRPMGYQAAVSDVLAVSGRQDGVAGRIAASIVSAAGEPIFTVEDVIGTADPDRGPLDGNLTVALLRAIYEVNNPEKTSPSPASTRSGTSSSSPESGAKPSPKPRKR